MISKRTIVTLLAFFILVTASSQNFKDVYESLQVNDRFSNMMNLRHYQEKNPDHAITYFLLGEIYNQYMSEANPLLMFNVIETNYLQALTHYGLLKTKLDEKQARQDREYFGQISIATDNKKVGIEDVIIEVDKRLAAIENYYQNSKTVHDNYFRCISKYNECLFRYREILADYPNYKNLYLLANQKLIEEVQTLGANFDSAIVYFDEYKKSGSALSHVLTINGYKLNQIVTYRLEGLIEADFSLPIVELWDFKSWANSFLEIINSDISAIKNGLIENDEKLSAQINKLKEEDIYSDKMDFYRTDLKFQNLIGKYDHTSICNNLIDYRQSKVQYLLSTRKTVNQLSDSSQFFLINKLWYYRDLANAKAALNLQAENLKKSISIDDVGKYFDFFSRRYNGMDGLIRWCEVEKWDNDQLFDINLKHLNEFIRRDKNRFYFKDSTLVYQHQRIAFGIQHPDSIGNSTDTLITTGFYPFKKWNYISGNKWIKGKNKSAFLAKVDPDGKIDWMIFPNIESSKLDSNVVVNQIQITDDSICWVASQAKVWKSSSEFDVQVIVSSYNWKGMLRKQVVSDVGMMPISFQVDEINEQYLLITKSLKSDSLANAGTMVKIALYTFNDSLLWAKQLTLNGNVIDVLNVNSNFFVVFNYSKFRIGSGAEIASTNVQNGSFGILKIFRAGSFDWVGTYDISEKLKLTSAYKLSSEELNFIGEIDKSNGEADKIFYMVTNRSGIPVFSNCTDLNMLIIPLGD